MAAGDTESRKLQGLDASNAEYLRYDHVRKDQRYLLAEHAGREEFDEEFQIRTCDMSRFLAGDAAEQRAFADDLGAALHEIGFAILVGHGIDPAIHARVVDSTRTLFNRPLEEKLRFRAERQGSVNQGYFPARETSDIHPDLVEGWVFCRRAFRIPGADHGGVPPEPESLWPDPALEPCFRALVEANERLILPVMQSLLMHLGVDRQLYDEKLTRTSIGLRLNWYPPLANGDRTSGAGRLLGHEDVGMFVFLPAPEVEGLQVLNRRNMKWIRLQAPRDSIILNTGDYVQLISNDYYPSTTHRVSQPRDPSVAALERITTPMNVYVWEDELLEVLPGLTPPRYEPIKAIQFHTASTSKFYGDDYAVNE